MLRISVLLLLSVAPSAAQANCKGMAFLWSHIYHPARLQVQKSCMSMTGTVAATLREKDGDLHIRVKPDPQYDTLLNAQNRSKQGGNLVVEPICDHQITQTDAIGICGTFHSTVPHYPKGTRVRVVGAYVLDKEHGWMELHPVVTITAIQ